MKLIAVAISAAVLMAVPSPAHAEEAAAGAEKAEKKKKKKITDRKHPDYVRCKSEPIIGSLARKRRVCMTNREWAAANQKGNDKSRTFVEDMQVGTNTSN